MNLGFCDLKAGDRARISGFRKGGIAHRQKLLSLGLTPGVEFSIERLAPFGDPVAIRVRNTFLSIRKKEANALLIEKISDGADTVDLQDHGFKFAIIGNPNTGKSTLFNTLTGVRQQVGNWPGVTVEKKVGVFELAGRKVELVDLPGIYSLDSYEESGAIDERIAQEYILSSEADCIIDIVDAEHLERNLYLTTQLLEMRTPLIVVLNVMEDSEGHAVSNVESITHRLGCPVVEVVATKKRDAGRLKAALPGLMRARSEPDFAITYPPRIEAALSQLSRSIGERVPQSRYDNRWLAIRLLEGDAFAAQAVGQTIKDAAADLIREITQELGEPDVIIAESRYKFIRTVAAQAAPETAGGEQDFTAVIDGVVLHRIFAVPIFLAVMYGLFWLTIKFSRVFKPFFNQVADTFLVEGVRHVLSSLEAPSLLVALLADGVGNGFLQVINFIPVIGFLYLFLSVLEESGYMARANFVMDRLMQSLGLPGNAFVPMMIGFGCNVPAIMSTRTLERSRDRLVAVLISPFMSCGGRLAVYTVFAAAFFPESGHLVIFSFYLLGVIFAMISALILKNSLLPEESSLFALELPSYHLPKLRNVLIGSWIRVKVFVFRVGRFIIPLVFIIKFLGVWGTDGSFHRQRIDQSVLAAAGRAITPVLAPMGVEQDQWPAAVALLTGVLHKVVIVSTLEAIYLDVGPRPQVRSFDPVDRLKKAALTIPANFKALVGFGPARINSAHSGADRLVDAAETREGGSRIAAVRGDLAPTLADRFRGRIPALAYLILLLCYPCIATTSATARETGRRWTFFMIFWTISLGYGMAVLFYQLGTFAAHPVSSTLWGTGIVLYFLLLGAAAISFSPVQSNTKPSTSGDEEEFAWLRRARNRGWAALAFLAALLLVGLGAMLVGDGQHARHVNDVAEAPEDPRPRAQQEQAAEPPASSQTNVGGVRAERPGEFPPRESAASPPERAPAPPSASDLAFPKGSVEDALVGRLDAKADSFSSIVWFELDRVRFAPGDSALAPASREQLQNIARILTAHPGVRAIVVCRPDGAGRRRQDLLLAKARAEIVALELKRMGIDPARIEVKDYVAGPERRARRTAAGPAISLGVIGRTSF